MSFETVADPFTGYALCPLCTAVWPSTVDAERCRDGHAIDQDALPVIPGGAPVRRPDYVNGRYVPREKHWPAADRRLGAAGKAAIVVGLVVFLVLFILTVIEVS